MIRSGSSLIFNFPCANEVSDYDTLTKNLKTHNPEILNKEEMKIDISEYGVGIIANSFSLEYAKSLGAAQWLSPRYLPINMTKKKMFIITCTKLKLRKEMNCLMEKITISLK